MQPVNAVGPYSVVPIMNGYGFAVVRDGDLRVATFAGSVHHTLAYAQDYADWSNRQHAATVEIPPVESVIS